MKNYIGGSARAHTFNNGGEVINLSLCWEDLQAIAKTPSKSGKHYIKVVIASKREEDQYGNTHSMYEDDFKPTEGGGKSEDNSSEEEKNDLPF